MLSPNPPHIADASSILIYLEDSEKELSQLAKSDREAIEKSTKQIVNGEYISQLDLENKMNKMDKKIKWSTLT